MGGGAWPFLVGGVIWLVNSVNERDRRLLKSWEKECFFIYCSFLEGLLVTTKKIGGNNRSVVPLDVLGRTRATMIYLA